MKSGKSSRNYQQLHPRNVSAKFASILISKQFSFFTVNSKQYQQLFVLFGVQFLNALEVLSSSTITSYQTSFSTNKIYEISIPIENVIVKLFSDINYCTCKGFQDNIVKKEKPTQFTCEHVLSLLLAIHLGKSTSEIITDEKFNQLIKEVY